MADIVLINPAFEVSYWGLEHAMPFLGKRAVLPVANLPLLAALTPSCHSVTLVDENVEAVDFERCAQADIVGLTGMNVQRRRMKEILHELKRRDIFTVVGGPWVTVREEDLADLADVLFIGEAEETWPRFLAEWGERRHQTRYEQAGRTDMATVPVPRLDLLRMKDYAFGSVQFSRGCPFECEFCDIIVTFGRRPRIKTSAQILAELDATVAAGKHSAFIVDDNLIGNKKAIKLLLRDVVAWQEEQGYPLILTRGVPDAGWDRRGYLSRRSGAGRPSACPRARRGGAVPRHVEGTAARRDPANPQCPAIAVHRCWRRLGADPRSAVGIAGCSQ